jgi:glycosyltransferase involved in cell wall biosynthesis
LEDSEFVVGWVGRLIKAKGADVFLGAVAELDDPGLRIVIIGDGPERAELEVLTQSLELSDRVSFCGSLQDVAHLFPAFDLFVLSSRTEGTPMVLFEAMAANVPIVATEVGGVPGVVRHDREALLVLPENPSALAVAMRVCVDDPEAAERRARAARVRLASDFSLEPWLDRYDEVYRRLVC